MQKRIIFRILGVMVIILSFGFGISFVINNNNSNSETETDNNDIPSNIYTEILYCTMADGNLQKALYYTSIQFVNRTNHSVPLVFLCHGFGGDMYSFYDVCLTFLESGYAILMPEFRGFGTNEGSMTLGKVEPYDLIQWLDYVETNLPAININQTGIAGHSLGGFYALSAYTIESANKGRFTSCVDISGPTNLSRELEFLTMNEIPLSNLPFVENLDEKNIINKVNETNPKNILIFHGTNDRIVDFQCSVDLMMKIDPNNNRTDVKFIPMIGYSHKISNDPEVVSTSIRWFNQYGNKSTTIT